MDGEQIRDFWAAQAATYGGSPCASWSDIRVIELEVATIGARLPAGATALDVGCANGFSSFRYAADRGVDVTGVDLIPGMIEAAEAARAGEWEHVRDRTRFLVGDARSLDFPPASFDVVVATRVVINLPSAAEQRTALFECARVLRPGGLLLLSEATLQGWQRLNILRAEWGLAEIPMPSFNLYLDEERVRDDVADVLDLDEVVNFASSYYVLTRLVKPLLAAATGAEIDVADPAAEFNRWAAAVPAAGDYGTQKLFVFRKR